MVGVDELLWRNAEFAAGAFQEGLRLTLRGGGLMVIGCVDPRVDPAHVLGLRNGEAAVLRNPGGRITPSTLRALKTLAKVGEVYSGNQPRPTNLVILHHTKCGLTGLTPYVDLLAEYFEVPAAELPARSVDDPYGSVRADAEIIRQRVHRPNYLVSGLVYDVDTGLVDVVVPPAQVPVD
ncbi:carbonic anhydrase [Kutzneria sp. CA-103260]|uniref:carbonic anhydrase n=1 Tax=Kutzneria sp. CA-103260 TaxID=2802641 RepID=UPI001BAA7660|nr:carbonic anhydrase [Kutzneria sp. CA-103260]QUQ65727.1 carbonic anhydrase [Kutzneria sp. CA-103260]